MKVLLLFLLGTFLLSVWSARRGRTTRAWPLLAGIVRRRARVPQPASDLTCRRVARRRPPRRRRRTPAAQRRAPLVGDVRDAHRRVAVRRSGRLHVGAPAVLDRGPRARGGVRWRRSCGRSSALYLIVFLTLVGDIVTTDGGRSRRTCPAGESIFFVNDQLILNPLEVLSAVTLVAWLLQRLGDPTWRFHRGGLFWPVMVFTGFVFFGILRGTLVGRRHARRHLRVPPAALHPARLHPVHQPA